MSERRRPTTPLADPANSPSQDPKSSNQTSLSQALSTTANLSNLLPTGTLMAFQLLTPLFTNNGTCDHATRTMTLIMLFVLALSCFIAFFTDSVKASNGELYYGLITFKGMILFDCPDEDACELGDLRKYKIRFVDVVHAFVSVIVFAVVVLRDKNVVSCFYPTPQKEVQEVLAIGPVGVGLLCSLLFMVFPSRRCGIGHPLISGKHE